MLTELEQAATAYKQAPRNLKAAIFKAAQTPDENGKRPTAVEIAKAIDFTYSPDYVARVIREARAQGRKNAGKS